MNSNTQVSPGIGALPDQFAPYGGLIVDLVGVNGKRLISQTAGKSMFKGWWAGFQPASPPPGAKPWLTVATVSIDLSVLSLLGGGIAQANLRISLYDGDSGSPNPIYSDPPPDGMGILYSPYSEWNYQPAGNDFDGGTNLYFGFLDEANNPVSCGYMGEATSYWLDPVTLATVYTFTGFPGEYALTDPLYASHPLPAKYIPPRTCTGWFSVPADKLATFYSALSHGSIRIGVHDVTPGDQYFDFTIGEAADIIDIPFTPVDPVLPTVTLAASKYVVSPGEIVTLTWTSSNADTVTLEPGTGGAIGLQGSTAVAIPSTITYTATATNADGTATASVTISILQVAIPQDLYLDLWVWRELGQFDSVDQELNFPPGYEQALVLSLASELWNEYPETVRAPWQAQELLLADVDQAVRDLEVLNASNQIALEPQA